MIPQRKLVLPERRIIRPRLAVRSTSTGSPKISGHKNVCEFPEFIGSGGSGPFDFASVPGCIVWLDPSDSANRVVVSGNVSQLTDKSGNGWNATQSTATDRPPLLVAEQNGLDMIDCNSGADWLVTSVITGVGNTRSIFVVAKPKAFSLVQYWETLTNSGGTPNGESFGIQDLGVPSKSLIYFGGSNYQAGSTTLTANVAKVFHVDRDLTGTPSATLYIENVSDGTGAVNDGSGGVAPKLTVGIRGDGFWPALSYIGDVIVYSPALSSANRAIVATQLALKWGT